MGRRDRVELVGFLFRTAAPPGSKRERIDEVVAVQELVWEAGAGLAPPAEALARLVDVTERWLSSI